MEPPIPPRPSFIPKQVLTVTPDKPFKKKALATDLFLALAVSLLTIAALFHGAAYLYKVLLERQINSPCENVTVGGGTASSCGLKATVELEERALNRETILVLQRVDKKLKLAVELGQVHTNLLSLFFLLEDLTLPSIAFRKLSFENGTVIAEGQAGRYEDLALQGDVLAQARGQVRDFSFSGLNLDEKGNVVFTLRLMVEPNVLAYLRS